MCNSHILSHKCTLPGKLYGACKRRIDRTAFFNAVEDSCHASLVALQDRRWWWLDLSNLSKTKLVSLERYVLSSSWSTHTDLRRKRPCRRSRRRRWLSRIRRLCVTSCTSPKACRRRRLLANAANGSLNSKNCLKNSMTRKRPCAGLALRPGSAHMLWRHTQANCG